MKKCTHPILSCADAADFEAQIIGQAEENLWQAMLKAGTGAGEIILQEWRTIGSQPRRLLLLLGKGYNGGDACIAAEYLSRNIPELEVDIVPADKEKSLKPLTRRALVVLKSNLEDRWRLVEDLEQITTVDYDLAIDGLLGMSFKAPINGYVREIIDCINDLSNIRFRVAIDLPSGLGDICDDQPLVADMTIATGIAKRPLFQAGATYFCGRRRYADIGIFDKTEICGNASEILLPDILAPLRRIRPAASDKRSFGHVMVLAGARGMLGAAAMCVHSALKAGAGLVTAFVPAQAVNAFSAAIPEAMWIPCPTDNEGIISREAFELIDPFAKKADAWVIGPGLGQSLEIKRMLKRLLSSINCPTVIDADALQAELILTAFKYLSTTGLQIITTPHVGEYLRMTGDKDSTLNTIDDDALLQFTRRARVTTVLKGTVTRICDGGRLIYSPFGGPMLARGGSGDCLAGILGARLAQNRQNTLQATCEAVAWHGRAADLLAQAQGEHAVRTTQLLDYLAPALRQDG